MVASRELPSQLPTSPASRPSSSRDPLTCLPKVCARCWWRPRPTSDHRPGTWTLARAWPTGPPCWRHLRQTAGRPRSGSKHRPREAASLTPWPSTPLQAVGAWSPTSCPGARALRPSCGTPSCTTLALPQSTPPGGQKVSRTPSPSSGWPGSWMTGPLWKTGCLSRLARVR